jgi:nicotinamide-nucleotide amidase
MAGVTPLRRAAIVAVGSELLTPARLDTNSLFITSQLNLLGIDVVSKAVVGDDRREIEHVLRALRERVDLVVFSGGLGPTEDDVTREAVATALDRAMSEDEGIIGRLRDRFVARGYATPMPESNRRQAMVPAGARVIENAHGSAPGLWIDDDRGVVVLLPGPPRELEPMLTALVTGWLRERAPGSSLARRVIRITGRIESQTDEVLQPLYRRWEASIPPVAATILAGLGHIELHLWTFAPTRESGDRALDTAVEQALEVLGPDAYSTDGRLLEQVLGDLLVQRGWRIAAAESCTGGLITSRLTDVPGSSRYVQEAVVTYANESKTGLLGVRPELIAEHGAVSEPVALAMAAGIRARAGVDVGIAVTGIAGPGGGSEEKPVGTVAVAAATADAARSRLFRFHGGRLDVKFQASQAALDMVRRMLLEH